MSGRVNAAAVKSTALEMLEWLANSSPSRGKTLTLCVRKAHRLPLTWWVRHRRLSIDSLADEILRQEVEP